MELCSSSIIAALLVLNSVTTISSSLSTDWETQVLHSIAAVKDQISEDGILRYQLAQSPNSYGVACYEDIGCFYRNGTFKHINSLPDSPKVIQTGFALYTRKNALKPVNLHYLNNSTLLEELFDPSKGLKVICHGFAMSGEHETLLDMKDAILEKDDCNVIIIDWHRGALVPFYMSAALDTELVGRQAARLIQLLKDIRGLKLEDTHIIGFSLGSHLAGFAGKWMKKAMGLTLGRITALDPASFLFEGKGEDVHVSFRDADFVDVMHTSAGTSVFSGELGMTEAVGHVDFYPNGGKQQPGCNGFICSHMRALDLFTETIHAKCNFRAITCQSYDLFDDGGCFLSQQQPGEMGYNSDLAQGRGVLYLATTHSLPFCGTSVLLTMKISNKQQKTYCGISVNLIGSSGINEHINITDSNSQKVKPGEILQKMAVVHSELLPLENVLLQYRNYKGWFFSGTESILFDSLKIQDKASHERFHYESSNTKLTSMDEKKLETTEV